MPLTELAREIYAVLRLRVQAAHGIPNNCKISYGDLVNDELPPLPDYPDLHYQDDRLDEALCELVVSCRAANRPAIAAAVVHDVVNGDGYPGNGYYDAAHPGIDDDAEQTIAWANELATVAQHNYPAIVNLEIPPAP